MLRWRSSHLWIPNTSAALMTLICEHDARLISDGNINLSKCTPTYKCLRKIGLYGWLLADESTRCDAYKVEGLYKMRYGMVVAV